MLKKRYIVVPRDQEAEIRLDYGKEIENDLIELILTEEDYIVLENVLFDKINQLLQVIIDDYEYEAIQGKENIQKVLTLMESIDTKIGTEQQLIEKIRMLFEEARQRGTGVYFFF